MISNIIVFTVLSILSAIAIHAVGQPISKSSPAQHALDADETCDVVPGVLSRL